MLLSSLVYSDKLEEFSDEIADIKEIFDYKNINLGIYESLTDKNHFIKIYCSDNDDNNKLNKMLNLYLSNSIYKMIASEYFDHELDSTINDVYFFIKGKELKYLKKIIKDALIHDGEILDENEIYCINRKNEVKEKIKEYLDENNELNIDGFLRFRIRDFKDPLDRIVDKVIERYMVQKEYNEFIKLLRYFVEIQECKMDEVNIIIDHDGAYGIQNKRGEDILQEFLKDVSDSKFNGAANIEDVIISGLITNVPKRIILHCVENCKNKELIDTIKNVFLDRVAFCNECSLCFDIKNKMNL